MANTAFRICTCPLLYQNASALYFGCLPLSSETSRMSTLADKTCVPCRGGVPPLTAEQIKPLALQVNAWNVVNNHHIDKEFRFPDFKTALDFVNKVGAIAEE